MPPPRHQLFTLSEAESAQWSVAIGRAFVNFSPIEAESFRWLHHFTGSVALAQSKLFKARINSIRAQIAASNWTTEQKSEANALWDEAVEAAKFRNIIAHNPVARVPEETTGERVTAIINFREINPSGATRVRMFFVSDLLSFSASLEPLAVRLHDFLGNRTGADRLPI